MSAVEGSLRHLSEKVGGVKSWEAAKSVLTTNGIYVTIVGDTETQGEPLTPKRMVR